VSSPIPAALLDTDILSAVMRQQPTALAPARAYLAVHHRLTFSIITRYEILRGLHAKRATKQFAAFDRLSGVGTITSV
jgi:tRNA(fMet)-specific endonuclease VapC